MASTRFFVLDLDGAVGLVSRGKSTTPGTRFPWALRSRLGWPDVQWGAMVLSARLSESACYFIEARKAPTLTLHALQRGLRLVEANGDVS